MTGPASRRARLLAALSALLALAGCTGLPPTTLGSAALQETTTAASGQIASLVWDLPSGEPTTLDYQQAGDYSPDLVVSNLCDSLLRLKPNETEVAGLAASWSRPDPLTLVLDLRHDVRFWDDTPLTSTDVVYSLDRQLDPAAIASGYFANVAAIKATGTYTVTISFSKPDELFLKELATTAGTVVEKRYAQRVGKNFGTATGGVMCSGPYELAAWNSGEDIVLKANPHYWDPAYQAHAKTVTLDFITDTTALTQALASGAIQGAFEVPTAALQTLRGSTTGRLYYGPSLESVQFIPVQSTGLSGTPDIRRALSLAINRTLLATTVYAGAATPLTTVLPSTGWDPESVSAYRQALSSMPLVHTSPTAADLAEAKALVAKHRSLIRTAVLAVQAGSQQDLETAAVIQQAAASIGIPMTIRQLPPLQFSSMFYDPTYRKGIDFAVSSAFLDVPDPLDWIPNLVTTGALFNWPGFSDPSVDADLAEAQQTFDPAARAALIIAAQRRWEAVTVDIPLLNLDEVTYMDRQLTGAPTSFSYLFTPSLALIGSR
jgi:peptide/nickel transport system substrate-binding protein